MKKKFLFILFIALGVLLSAQKGVNESINSVYRVSRILLNPYRLPVSPDSGAVKYIDLDKDGDPDVLETMTQNNIPVRWIDDDDDMKKSDLQGDIDNDCLMIDKNRDGKYGDVNDLNVDWIDNDGDGKADMQVVVQNSPEGKIDGQYMWFIDTDKDNIFNYIDWNTMEMRCWIHHGQSDFYADYHGKSLFLKVHRNVDEIKDPRMNWENPFLFYDHDNDGLSEMAIRLIDTKYSGNFRSNFTEVSGNIIWTSMSFDLDNDNAPGNEFDLDMTVNFSGPGFNYMDQIHKFENMRGLPASDTMFRDPRFRQMTELIYPDHESAWDLIHRRGKWDRVYFVFDEDDDCGRWERVELYHPGDMYDTSGPERMDPGQADATGDRGEWDLDNSGNGNLYIANFDGRIHLHGAEWGAWRIDQNAWSWQGMGGLYDGYGPGKSQRIPDKFPVIKYTDTDNNGFLDKIEYDLDGDTIFEHAVSLHKIGLSDKCEVVSLAGMDYTAMTGLFKKVSDEMWAKAMEAVKVAEKRGIDPGWFSHIMSPKSIHQKYSYGYWLQLYLYQELMAEALLKGDHKFLKKLDKAYFSGNWGSL